MCLVYAEVFYHVTREYLTDSIIKTHNGYRMRRKDRKWPALTPGKWIGFSILLPSILSICACGSANIASKGVPGKLKPFLITLKRVFSTFWRCCNCFFHVEDFEKINIP